MPNTKIQVLQPLGRQQLKGTPCQGVVVVNKLQVVVAWMNTFCNLGQHSAVAEICCMLHVNSKALGQSQVVSFCSQNKINSQCLLPSQFLVSLLCPPGSTCNSAHPGTPQLLLYVHCSFMFVVGSHI